MNINVLSVLHSIPGQGTGTMIRDHMFLLKNSREWNIYTNHKDHTEIQHAHDIDPSVFFRFLGKRRRSLNILSAHVAPQVFYDSFVFSKIWAPFVKIYMRMLTALSDVVLAVSEESALEFQRSLGVPAHKIEVFPNFVRRDLFWVPDNKKAILRQEIRSEMGYADDDFIVISAGQPTANKGIMDFLETAKQMPDVQFLWVGQSHFKYFARNYFEIQKAIENAPSNVRFTGLVDHERLRKLYSAADMLFFPSRYETFGLVVVEASGSGLPLLLRDLDVYKKAFTKRYLAGRDVDEFVDSIRLLKNNRDAYTEASDDARELFKSYDDRSAYKRLREVYTRWYRKKFKKDLRLDEQ